VAPNSFKAIGFEQKNMSRTGQTDENFKRRAKERLNYFQDKFSKIETKNHESTDLKSYSV
jgi:hypothetical protein